MYFRVIKNGQFFQLCRKYKDTGCLIFFETNEELKRPLHSSLTVVWSETFGLFQIIWNFNPTGMSVCLMAM